jgi:hypothetical protein
MKIIRNGHSIIDNIELYPNGEIKWSFSTFAALMIYYIIPLTELFLFRSIYSVMIFTFASFCIYAQQNSLFMAFKTLFINLIFIGLFIFMLGPLLIIDLFYEFYGLIKNRNTNLWDYLDKIRAFISIYITFILSLPVILMVMADCIKYPISD